MFSLDAIETRIPAIDSFRRAPTDRWNPDVCGDIDLCITVNGEWVHEGTVIKRAGLVRLLASVLVFEDEQYWLKTPTEKLRLSVDDAPFVVQDLQADTPQAVTGRGEHGQVRLRTNMGEDITLNKPWTLKPTSGGEQLPWIPIAHGLYARLSRNLYYHLCHQAMAGGDRSETDGVLYWHAAGLRWPLGKL